MIRTFVLIVLFVFCLNGMNNVSAQSAAPGESEKTTWNGKKARLTLKEDRGIGIRGEIIRTEKNGVVFDPDRSSPFYDASARLYLFTEIDKLVGNDEETLYRSGEAVPEHVQIEETKDEPKSASDSSFIQLNSDKILNGNVELKSPFLRSRYLLFNESTKYDISAVKAFQNEEGYFVKVKYGFFKQEKLAKRVQRGKIDLYSVYVHSGSGVPIFTTGHLSLGVSIPAKVDYFSKNGQDVQKASYGNLKKALFDNPESMKYLNAHRTLQFVAIGMVVAGLTTIIVSVANVEKGGPATARYFYWFRLGSRRLDSSFYAAG